ncbi:hypothetical protein CTA1_11528 [Colletotrichum tanaceti]|uniref:Ubiquitin-like protease family profile domain-containing protein n=1 Tax=Colletotrichum tanaceti TaxID=1306861 RepID=A0A4U6XPP7_9PEZI|nr:hypothetical protein CTA1_11528 [Colletotrichum tanaceti]
MTNLDQCLRNVLELPFAVNERRLELWEQLEQAYASSPPRLVPESFKHQAIADKKASADNIVYRLNSVARAFDVTPEILVDFFGSQVILNRNSLEYLKALCNLRPATTFLELLAAFERKRRFDELMSPAKALKQVVQSLHPNAVSTRQSRKRAAAAASTSPLQGSEIPQAATDPAALTPEPREPEAFKQEDLTPKLAFENPTTAEQAASVTTRTSTPEPFEEGTWQQASLGMVNSTTPAFPIPGPDREPLRIQDSTIASISPSRLFDTSLGDFDSTDTSGGLDLETFDDFLGSVNTSTPHKPKATTVEYMAPHQATTHLKGASKRASSRGGTDATPASKRSRHDPDATGSSSSDHSSLRVTLEAIAESWCRLDRDWLDDRVVNLAISRLATVSVGTVDSLIFNCPVQNNTPNTLQRLAPLRNKDTILMPFYTPKHWTLFRFVKRSVTAFLKWLYEDENLQITVETKACPLQDNTSDCGVFAVAFADSLAKTGTVSLCEFPDMAPLWRKALQRMLLSSPHSIPPAGRLAQLSDAVLPDLVGDPLEQSVALQKKIWDRSAKLSALLSHLDPSQTRQALESNRAHANATAALMSLEKLHRMHLKALGRVLADSPYMDGINRLSKLTASLDVIRKSLNPVKSTDLFGNTLKRREARSINNTFEAIQFNIGMVEREAKEHVSQPCCSALLVLMRVQMQKFDALQGNLGSTTG